MNLDLSDLLQGLDPSTISSITGMSSQEAAIMAALSALSSLISFAIAVLLIVAMWKLFTKAGDKGWKAIIPFYNQYTLFKLTWKRKWFWVTLIISVIICVLACILLWDVMVYTMGGAPGVSEETFMTIVLALTAAIVVLSIPLAIISIVLCFKIAKAYGKGAGFGFGLLFFYPIFLCVLAFGAAQYARQKVGAAEPAPVPVAYSPVTGGYVPQTQQTYAQPQAYTAQTYTAQPQTYTAQPVPAQTYVPASSYAPTSGTYEAAKTPFTPQQ